MAQKNKNTKKPQGLCQRIHNAVNPFRSRTRRTSHHHHKPNPDENTENPVRNSSPQTGPVRISHQHSLGKNIPIEVVEHFTDQRETVTDSRQKLVKSVTKKVKYSQRESEDDSMVEKKFSDYIRNVKDRMARTASNVTGDGGGGGAETSATRRDSFNDKLTDYINRTKSKIRKTSSAGDGKSFYFKNTENET